MLVDANLLLYAVDESSPFHGRSRDWLESVVNGDERVGMPWESLAAFLRVVTNPRALPVPLQPDDAWDYVRQWLDSDRVWVPMPTSRHADILGRLLVRHRVRGPLISDARIAALALEHGLVIASADSDFALFDEVTWHNPIA